MARVNINILGICKLKWTGMGEFNSDDHYIYYCGQESLRRNGVVLIVNKCSIWMQPQKWQNDLCSFRRQTIQYHGNLSLCPKSNAEEAEVEWFYEKLLDLLELTPPKVVLFIIGDQNAKVGSQEISGETGKFGLGVQNEAGQKLAEFCRENALVIANTIIQKHKKRFYTWISPDGQHWNQIDYILCSQRWRSSVQSAKTRPGADYGSYHELLISKFRLKLKKVGKTTRPFRYDRNQIPYDYAVEVRNRFKGLDLIDRVPDELWMEVHNIVQETGIKTILTEKKCKKQNGCLGRPYN